MTTYNPQHEQKQGSDLSGTSADENRTYVLANDGAILANMQILVARAIDQVISIDYWTSSTAATGDTYCTTLQVIKFSGIGVEIQLENLGTGDGSTTSYDTEKGNIIADSYTLYWAPEGDNDLNTLSEGSDYTILKDSGAILLTSAGVTKVEDNVIYISYTYSKKMSDTFINSYLAPASREVDNLTENYYGTEKTSTEYFDGYTSGYPQTDRPYANQIDNLPEFELSNQSVQSITSVQYLDNVGDVDDENGRVILTSSTVPNGKRNVKIIYTHGYTSIPAQVQELAALLAGIMALVNISGGSYDDVTSFGVGRINFTVGEVYVNIREVIAQLKARVNSIVLKLGGNYSCA